MSMSSIPFDIGNMRICTTKLYQGVTLMLLAGKVEFERKKSSPMSLCRKSNLEISLA